MLEIIRKAIEQGEEVGRCDIIELLMTLEKALAERNYYRSINVLYAQRIENITSKWQGEALARQAMAQEVERLERLNTQQERELDRLRGLENIYPMQKHTSLAQSTTQPIEVGAIVEHTGSFEGNERGVAISVNGSHFDVDWRDSFGHCNYNIDTLYIKPIFPASHPVAQSLASRKDGTFKLGDVVRVVSTGHKVTIREWNGEFGAFYDTDNDHWEAGHRIELITPRELRTDIGDAFGGEWETWFPVKVCETCGFHWLGNETCPSCSEVEQKEEWRPKAGEWVRWKTDGKPFKVTDDYKDGTFGIANDTDRLIEVWPADIEPWTPQVGDEVRVLVGTTVAGFDVTTDIKHFVCSLGSIMQNYGEVVEVRGCNSLVRRNVKPDQLEPWTE